MSYLHEMFTPRLGSGERFRALAARTSPALAAFIGRKKYGAKRFAALALAGRKRKAQR